MFAAMSDSVLLRRTPDPILADVRKRTNTSIAGKIVSKRNDRPQRCRQKRKVSKIFSRHA